MVHVKQLLDNRRPKADGTHSVIFRITHYKKVYTISSGIAVHAKHWNAGTVTISKDHPNAQELNALLSKKYYQIQNAVLRLTDTEEFSIHILKLQLAGKRPKVSHTVQSFTNDLIAEMLELNQAGNALVYKTALNRLINFSGNVKLRFEDLNYTLLDKFTKTLMAEGVSVNAISNYLRTIRAIYNKAIKVKIVDRSSYPFHELSIKTQKTVKRSITKRDITSLEALNLETNSKLWHARNYFLLSYYLIGISFTDMAYLKPQNLIKGRVEYRRRKTHKLYSIRLLSKAETILSQYPKPDGRYLLPVLLETVVEDNLNSKRIISQWIKTSNKYLKRLSIMLELPEPITTYVGRHTWATTAKKLGYSNELIAEALGHEYGNRITNIYLDSFDREVVDEMHIKVIE